MHFKERILEIHFILDKKLTFSSGDNIKIINQDLDIIANIKKNGGSDSANISIKNMNKNDIDTLIKVRFKPLELLNNQILIYAGYDGVKKLIYKGDIMKTSVMYGGDSSFNIESVSNVFHSVNPNPSTYLEGTQDANNIFQDLAQKAELKFKNIDVKNTFLNDPILKGGLIEQIKELGDILDISVVFTDDTCIIKNRGTSISNDIIELDSESGLIGFPSIDDLGVVLKCQFNANIIFDGSIRVKSNFTQANGLWRVYNLEHSISSRSDNFDTIIKGVPIGELQ